MAVFRLPRSRCSYRCYRCGCSCCCYCGLIRCVTGRSALWSVVGPVVTAVCCAGRLSRSFNAAAPRTRSSAVPWAAAAGGVVDIPGSGGRHMWQVVPAAGDIFIM